MNVMTIYAFQNSLNFTLFDMKNESVIASGVFERIGMDASRYIIQYQEDQIVEELDIVSYEEVAHILLDKLISLKIIDSYEDIYAIGHKLLFGGESFPDKVFLSNEVITRLSELSWTTSLKASLQTIASFSKAFPNVDMVGIFDTSFYHTLPEESYLYGVPYSWYINYGIRKYGFQGIHHQYLAEEIEKILGREDIRVISCFLDSESSVSAIVNGECLDTSMGFTSLTGLVMGTKSGDVDPSIIPYIMEKEGKNVGEVLDDLNHSSGLLGLSESSADMRDIMALCDDEHPKVVLAKNKFVRRVVDYISQYYVLLEGADAIVFSGFIGENNSVIREEICDKLSCLGVKIDVEENSSSDKVRKISSSDSSVFVYVLPSNEELMMAREVIKLKNR